MFSIVLFIAYLDYILCIVRIHAYSYIRLHSAHSLTSWVSDQQHVSMVLRCGLSTIAPYILGSVVDRGCDTSIESFVVHTLNIGIVGSYHYYRRLALFLIFLSNIPLCVDIKCLCHDC
jgi:hypothetical protein